MRESSLTIALGTDHAGYPLKEALLEYLKSKAIKTIDCGSFSDESCDYPDFIRPAARKVISGEANRAIVLGGSGNGEAIAANKIKGIRCALCYDVWSAEMASLHNNANCIAIGARPTPKELAIQIVDTWLSTPFEGGRHQRRIDKIESTTWNWQKS